MKCLNSGSSRTLRSLNTEHKDHGQCLTFNLNVHKLKRLVSGGSLPLCVVVISLSGIFSCGLKRESVLCAGTYLVVFHGGCVQAAVQRQLKGKRKLAAHVRNHREAEHFPGTRAHCVLQTECTMKPPKPRALQVRLQAQLSATCLVLISKQHYGATTTSTQLAAQILLERTHFSRDTDICLRHVKERVFFPGKKTPVD